MAVNHACWRCSRALYILMLMGLHTHWDYQVCAIPSLRLHQCQPDVGPVGINSRHLPEGEEATGDTLAHSWVYNDLAHSHQMFRHTGEWFKPGPWSLLLIIVKPMLRFGMNATAEDHCRTTAGSFCMFDNVCFGFVYTSSATACWTNSVLHSPFELFPFSVWVCCAAAQNVLFLIITLLRRLKSRSSILPT